MDERTAAESRHLKVGEPMGAVRENQAEFLVVLKIDDEESYRHVNSVIEPLLDDSHVDLIDTEMLDLGWLERSQPAYDTLDIMNDDDVKKLLEVTPPEKRKEVMTAVSLLRSINESLAGIVEGQSGLLQSAKDINARAGKIRARIETATRRSRSELAKLGF